MAIPHLSSVQNPYSIESWLVKKGIPRSWIIMIPTSLASIIMYNHQPTGLWTRRPHLFQTVSAGQNLHSRKNPLGCPFPRLLQFPRSLGPWWTMGLEWSLLIPSLRCLLLGEGEEGVRYFGGKGLWSTSYFIIYFPITWYFFQAFPKAQLPRVAIWLFPKMRAPLNHLSQWDFPNHPAIGVPLLMETPIQVSIAIGKHLDSFHSTLSSPRVDWDLKQVTAACGDFATFLRVKPQQSHPQFIFNTPKGHNVWIGDATTSSGPFRRRFIYLEGLHVLMLPDCTWLITHDYTCLLYLIIHDYCIWLSHDYTLLYMI